MRVEKGRLERMFEEWSPVISIAEKDGGTRNFSSVIANSGRSMDGRFERGIAILEASVCLVVFLPVALLAVFVTSLVHDENIVRAIPHQLLRENQTGALSFQAESGGIVFGPNQEALERSLGVLVESAIGKLSSQALLLSESSAVACSWVLSVDRRTGLSRGKRVERCQRAGSIGRELSLERELGAITSEPVGLPLYGASAEDRYLDSVVVIGVKAAGRVPDFAERLAGHVISFGEVVLPRQEVSL
jgi:hypothetical protein